MRSIWGCILLWTLLIGAAVTDTLCLNRRLDELKVTLDALPDAYGEHFSGDEEPAVDRLIALWESDLPLFFLSLPRDVIGETEENLGNLKGVTKGDNVVEYYQARGMLDASFRKLKTFVLPTPASIF
ncbi:MAG: hypothetical protein MJ078_02895 [Clostridia bacterium]|nr:hypothetical protein [Clostridia bacterium]